MLSVSLIIRRLFVFRFAQHHLAIVISCKGPANLQKIAGPLDVIQLRSDLLTLPSARAEGKHKVRLPVQRKLLYDPGLFSEGEGLNPFISIALRQAFESENGLKLLCRPYVIAASIKLTFFFAEMILFTAGRKTSAIESALI